MALSTQIPRASLFWILAFMLLLLAPHVTRMPAWVTAACIVCMIWRFGIHSGRIGYPGRTLRTLLVLAVIPAAFLQYDSSTGAIDISVSLLLVGGSFKLLEMRERRDVYIVIVLGFLLVLAGFIYNQSILSAGYNLLATLMLFSCMYSMNSSDHQSENLRLSAILLLQSLPVMLVLFILVPRIAPLWAMPLPTGSTQTGISEEMTPGDVTRLGRSGELAFRAKFNGVIPANDTLYWRGLVLDHFDGQTWRRSRGALLQENRNIVFPEAGASADQLEYDIILEPTQQPWLFGIQLAEALTPGILLDRNATLISTRPVSQRMRYEVRSHPGFQMENRLSRRQLMQSLQLPESGNPQSLEYAAELRLQYPDDRALVQAVLQQFNQQQFFYTLTPPALSESSIDDFLFQTREGFCAHFAGSMVFLLRAAGIPARVVAGYQGAEFNRFDEYLMVYQYNAHAWTEVWLEGEGWTRFDPTAWVAPDRIRQGAETFFAESNGFLEESPFSMLRFRDTAWLNTLRLRLDSLDYAWNRWVISYDSELQLELLQDLLGDNARRWTVPMLVGLVTLLMAVLALWLWWQQRNRSLSRAEHEYLAFCRRMERKGWGRHTGEGVKAYSLRLAQINPEAAESLQLVSRLMQQQLYAKPETVTEAQNRIRLKALIQHLRKLGKSFQQQQTG